MARPLQRQYYGSLHVTVGQAVRDLELIAKALGPQDMRN